LLAGAVRPLLYPYQASLGESLNLSIDGLARDAAIGGDAPLRRPAFPTVFVCVIGELQ